MKGRKMDIEVTYKEMAYIRALLQKDNPRKDSIDADINEALLAKLYKLEEDYAAGLIA